MEQPFSHPAYVLSPSFGNIDISSVADAHQQYHQARIEAKENIDLLVCLVGGPHPSWAKALAELDHHRRTAQACLRYLSTDHQSRKPGLISFMLGFIKTAWGPHEWRLEEVLFHDATDASGRLGRWLQAGASWEDVSSLDELALPSIHLDMSHKEEKKEDEQ